MIQDLEVTIGFIQFMYFEQFMDYVFSILTLSHKNMFLRRSASVF